MSYEYYAFISYSHKNIRLAKWIQKRLEHYKLPSETHSDIKEDSNYLRPIFRDKSDLNTGILSEELKKKLKESKYLIVICSKHSANSEWVSEEVKYFINIGRISRIIPIIKASKKRLLLDLMPKSLREYINKNPNQEILGISIGDGGKNKALVKVISRMLEISFDSLWKRHLRQKKRRIATMGACFLLGISIFYIFAIPVSLNIHITPEKSRLPTDSTIVLTVDSAHFISPIGSPYFNKIKIPGYRRFSSVHLKIASEYFISTDTIISPGLGIHKDLIINLYRDDTFAFYKGEIYNSNMEPLEDVTVTVGNVSTKTNKDGVFEIRLPIEEQNVEMPILIEKTSYKSVAREDEIPGLEHKYIMEK